MIVTDALLLSLPAVPFKRPPQSLFDAESRRMAQLRYCGRNIGLRVSHVARAGRFVAGGNPDAFHFLQSVPQEIQRIAAAVTRVVHFSFDAPSVRRFDAQFGHILDIGKVARLLAVARRS